MHDETRVEIARIIGDCCRMRGVRQRHEDCSSGSWGVEMSSWFGRWLAYGLGRTAGKAIFDEGDGERGDASPGPVRQQTEAEILEAEKRYDAEARQYAAEDAARKHRDR
jgi:hypothetical protein